MNKNQSIVMMSVIVVLIFACAGFGYSSMTNKARALKAESELASLRKIVDADLNKKTATATARRRSSNQPASTNPVTADAQNPEPAADAPAANPNRNRGQNYLENLKESDPEAYAAEIERRNNVRKQMQDNSNKQVEFIKKLDTKSMTLEQLENHNKLLPLVTKNNQLINELTQNPDAENASDLRRELGDNARQMGALMTTERSAALQQFAKQIGYQSNQTAQFEAYIKSVYDMTSGNPFPGGFRGGGNSGPAQGQPTRQ